ncbi:hypothetical protein QN362_08650 [Actimicrobium sp. CCC2.4]|uniref:hypothetical protein n=1 Tax=Actimicrobium sp. CCC2.4 TaxID=3048606 RepID=UPI002AC8FF04|nr:hypothetical protein [Actimicrobium sp. CCC2.4]MEB0135402.1 hypothetical protein [Actimicrobium sp. CCC2.4]WPX32424.1 hypothetical protein RHM62_00835 [Actimicrobium sp. CCC2.4]
MQIRSFIAGFLFLSSMLGIAPQLHAASATALPVTPVIERFFLQPVDPIEPGTELKFTAGGTPRAKASLSIDGVIENIPMREEPAGVYEAAYTVRRQDILTPATGITVVLEVAGQVVQATLAQTLLVKSPSPAIKHATPRDGETMVTNPVLISATFDDANGMGIDAKTVKILLSGKDITRNATVTTHFFSYRLELQPGAYTVEASAQDIAGRLLQQIWSFNVASAAIPASTTLPLQISSPVNNAQVGPGTIDVRGNTAPDAKLEVKVQAVAAIAGFVGLRQQIYTQTLKADSKGYFSFSFLPHVTVAGTRYEVTINASKSEMTRDIKLVLFQQK